ncbi:MAG: hypothetical protein Q8Q14_03335 [Gemmatimonadales bacterium]|nr:hypothetical protein [Gemmatimonadales bacterium]
MVEWLLIAGGAVLALTLIVVIIGYLLPREHTATSSVIIPHPPDSVW